MSKEEELKDLLKRAKEVDSTDDAAMEAMVAELETAAVEGLEGMMTPPKRPEGAHFQLRAVPDDEKGTVSCEISCHGMTSGEVSEAMMRFIEAVNRDFIN